MVVLMSAGDTLVVFDIFVFWVGGKGVFRGGGSRLQLRVWGVYGVERDKVDDRRVEQDFDAGCGRV